MSYRDDPRYEVKVHLSKCEWMSLDQEEALMSYLIPAMTKMIKEDGLRKFPKGYANCPEWKVNWKKVDDIPERLEECISEMPSWKLRWAFESAMAESLRLLAKSHPDELAKIMARNFYSSVAYMD